MIVQTFRLSTAHIKFQQICTLIGSFCWKYIKVQLKKYRGVMSHDPEEWYNIWRKTDFLFQKWQEFGEFWPEHSNVSRICTLIGSYCANKLFNVWPKKVQWSYLSWHWSVIQNLKKNSLVVWKMTRIWQIFTRALKMSKLGL